jgi:hypothetical protein
MVRESAVATASSMIRRISTARFFTIIRRERTCATTSTVVRWPTTIATRRTVTVYATT